MIYLSSWCGFKRDGWGCVLEVFITHHAFVWNKCRPKSNVLSCSPPGSHCHQSVLWRLPEALWLLHRGCQAVPWGCASEAVGILGPAPASQAPPKIQAHRNPGEGGLFHLWKVDVLCAHEIQSLLQKTAVIGRNSREASLLVVYMTLWKWNMRDHYPSSFKSGKCEKPY